MSNEELAVQIKNGDADQLPVLFARVEAFINMKAEQAARKLPPSAGQTVDDLRQCGWLALCDAVGRFDPERGAFLTALSFALKTQFASLCGVRSTRRDALSLALSLDRPAFSDDLDGGLLLDSVDDSTAQNGYIEVEEAVYREELHAALERELCTLPTIDASLIRKRYWGGETLTSIAADAGFSVNRASQIHRDAIRKLRRPQHERALRQYIEESTDYYKPCGAAKFRRTGVSPVEGAVLRREDAEERFIRRQMGNGLE